MRIQVITMDVKIILANLSSPYIFLINYNSILFHLYFFLIKILLVIIVVMPTFF